MDAEAVLKIFKCGICEEMLQIPKHLPCDHDVCEKCLESYIIRTVPMTGYDLHEHMGKEKVEFKPSQDYFVCPASGCDNKYKVIYPHKNTIHWASMVSNCLRTTYFMELFHGKRRHDIKLCDVCMISANPLSATEVCTDCLSLYCVKCAFMHRQLNSSHKIVDVEVFENASSTISDSAIKSRHECAVIETENQRPATNNDYSDQVSRLNQDSNPSIGSHPNTLPGVCPIHIPCEKVIYCKDCSVACCIKCSDTKHAACKQVHSIQTLAKKLIAINLDQTLKARIETLLEICSASLSKYLRYEIKIGEMAKAKPGETTAEVSSLQEQVSNTIRLLVFLYTRGKRRLSKICSIDYSIPGTFIQTVFYVEKESLILQEEFIKLVSRDVEGKIALLNKELRSKQNREMDANEDTNKSDHEHADEGMVFDTSIALTDSLLKFKQTIEADMIDGTNEVTWETDILAKTSSDENDCWLTDYSVLHNMDIIVADHANKKVKLIHGQKEVRELQLDSAPWALCVNKGEDECFVTCPNEHKIVVLDIRKGDLFIRSEIDLNIEVNGVGSLNDGRLLVTRTCHDAPYAPVCVVQRDGSINEMKVKGHVIDDLTFARPRHVKVIAGETLTVYVSDFQKDTISRLSMLKDSEKGTGTVEEDIETITGDDEEDLRKVTVIDNETQVKDYYKLVANANTSMEDEDITSDTKSAQGLPLTDHQPKITESIEIEENKSSSQKDKINISENNPVTISKELEATPEEAKPYTRSDCPETTTQSTCEVYLDLIKQTTIQYPTGIDVDQIGEVYVCCNSEGRVVRLSEDGKLRFRLIDIPLPRALVVKHNRLYVTVDSGPRKNCIMVYKLHRGLGNGSN